MKELGFGVSVVVAVLAADAHADVELSERPGHVTEARVIVDATPAEVYALVTSYASWPSFLSDVTSVRVESGEREHARVQFRSRALGHTVTVVFTNDPDRAISFRGVAGPPGGRAHGRYVLNPIDGGKRTEIIARFYMDVVGAPGLFVRDSTVTNMRRNKLRADMADTARYIETHRASSSAAR
jgi:hypothetical protein